MHQINKNINGSLNSDGLPVSKDRQAFCLFQTFFEAFFEPSNLATNHNVTVGLHVHRHKRLDLRRVIFFQNVFLPQCSPCHLWTSVPVEMFESPSLAKKNCTLPSLTHVPCHNLNDSKAENNCQCSKPSGRSDGGSTMFPAARVGSSSSTMGFAGSGSSFVASSFG